jgi:hypothetical protein
MWNLLSGFGPLFLSVLPWLETTRLVRSGAVRRNPAPASAIESFIYFIRADLSTSFKSAAVFELDPAFPGPGPYRVRSGKVWHAVESVWVVLAPLPRLVLDCPEFAGEVPYYFKLD